jgi:hypothetical protein
VDQEQIAPNYPVFPAVVSTLIVRWQKKQSFLFQKMII